jgi:hypothetical protein
MQDFISCNHESLSLSLNESSVAASILTQVSLRKIISSTATAPHPTSIAIFRQNQPKIVSHFF